MRNPNVIHISKVLSEEDKSRYSNWTMETTVEGRRRGLLHWEYTQQVLGPHDFCWDGFSTRHWVWVRDFKVLLGARGSQMWFWRLFVSKQGYSLEIGNKYEAIDSGTARIAGPQALDHFLENWEDGKGRVSK